MLKSIKITILCLFFATLFSFPSFAKDVTGICAQFKEHALAPLKEATFLNYYGEGKSITYYKILGTLNWTQNLTNYTDQDLVQPNGDITALFNADISEEDKSLFINECGIEAQKSLFEGFYKFKLKDFPSVEAAVALQKTGWFSIVYADMNWHVARLSYNHRHYAPPIAKDQRDE